MRRFVLTALVAAWAGLTAGVGAPSAAEPVRLTSEWRDRIVSALAAHRAGEWKTAARELGEASLAPTPIPEYLLYLQAESLDRLGEAPAARAAAAQAVERAGDGPLSARAWLLAARLASRAGDEAAAIPLYRRLLERHPEHSESAQARHSLAQALTATGQTAEALRAYRAIWLLAPASAFAESAAQQQRMLAARGVAAPPLTQRERLERAERLLSAGAASPARVEAEALLSEGPAVDLALRALRVVTEASRRTSRFDDALKAVDRALALAPVDRRPPWLLERAKLSSKNREQAFASIDRIVAEFPKSPEAPAALLLRAQLLEGIPSPGPAEAAYARLGADYPDDEEAATAFWRLGWLSWLRGAHAEAAQRWMRVTAIRGGQRLRDGAAYWAGRAHDARGDTEAAARQWSALVASTPRSYYGALAAARLGRTTAAPAADTPRPAVSLPADPLDSLRRDERYAKVVALRAVGLGPFADGEMDEMTRRAAGDQTRLYSLSAAYAQDARYHLALRILRREFVPMAWSGTPATPRSFWEMFYPLGWRAELTGAAGRAALDPLFVAAIVREESSFDPRARSRVGARGLMQLMPETARPMARARGLAFQEGELLDEPAANLDMGAAFMSGLIKEFGDPRLAIAAYNAGPRRVREWWAARRTEDLEVWVEQIPFLETRAFVKRVMLAWGEYRRLYGGQP